MTGQRVDEEVVGRITAEVADGLTSRAAGDARRLGPVDAEALARRLLADALEVESRLRMREATVQLSADAEDAVAQAVIDRLFGLGRVQRWIDDPDVSDIEINGADCVWLRDFDGTVRAADGPAAESDDALVELVRAAAARLGQTERRFDAANPEVSISLPGLARLHAIMGVTPRPVVTIRCHRIDLASLDALEARGMFTAQVGGFLRAAVAARLNLVVSGSMGSGKTTLLRALVNEVPASERLVSIEDPYELGLDRLGDRHPNVAALEARPANIEGHGEISLLALTKASLRMNASRVFVGEIRGAEFAPMLSAMTNGSSGSGCTIHADSARQVFPRFEQYGWQVDPPMTPDATARHVANAVDLVVHVDGAPITSGGRARRRVTEILEVVDCDGPVVLANDVFTAGPDGAAVRASGPGPSDRLVGRLAAVEFDARHMTAVRAGVA